MRKLLVFIVTVIIIVLLLHVALYVFINVRGKDLIQEALEKNFNAQADIEKVSLKFPFSLEIKNFSSQDLSFGRAIISLSLSRIADFPLIINTVYVDGLHLKLTKDKEGIYINPFIQKNKDDSENRTQAGSSVPDGGSKDENKEEESGDLYFALKNLYCKNSVLELVLPDLKKPANIVFSDIDIEVHNFQYPQLPEFSLDLHASVLSPEGSRDMKDALRIKGDLDWQNKDMDMMVDITGFDYLALSKFYPEVWQPKNLGIEEACLTLNTKLKAISNDLTIDWLITLEKISFASTGQEASSSRMKLLKTVIAFFQKEDDKPRYRFVYKTKLDSPWQFFPSLLEDLRSSLPIGPALIAETVIEKTKEKISKNAGQAIEKTKESLGKGVEGVKKITVDTAIDVLDNTFETLKSIIGPDEGDTAQQEKTEPESE